MGLDRCQSPWCNGWVRVGCGEHACRGGRYHIVRYAWRTRCAMRAKTPAERKAWLRRQSMSPTVPFVPFVRKFEFLRSFSENNSNQSWVTSPKKSETRAWKPTAMKRENNDKCKLLCLDFQFVLWFAEFNYAPTMWKTFRLSCLWIWLQGINTYNRFCHDLFIFLEFFRYGVLFALNSEMKVQFNVWYLFFN